MFITLWKSNKFMTASQQDSYFRRSVLSDPTKLFFRDGHLTKQKFQLWPVLPNDRFPMKVPPWYWRPLFFLNPFFKCPFAGILVEILESRHPRSTFRVSRFTITIFSTSIGAQEELSKSRSSSVI